MTRSAELLSLLDEASDGDMGAIRRMYEFVKDYMSAIDKSKLLAALTVGGAVGAAIAVHILTPYTTMLISAAGQIAQDVPTGWGGGEAARNRLLAISTQLSSSVQQQYPKGFFTKMWAGIQGANQAGGVIHQHLANVASGGWKGALSLASAEAKSWVSMVRGFNPSGPEQIVRAIKTGALTGAAVLGSLPLIGGFITAWKKNRQHAQDPQFVNQGLATIGTSESDDMLREEFIMAAVALRVIYD